ncbi:MAG: nitroreductase family protein [Candidatus Micrarchaeota archaeon]|nr:nitroreductase family protein [Candidatus Micrarchaeota archaeon]
MAEPDSFLAALKSRANTYRFTTEPVRERELRFILEAGRWAPSCLNIQPWHFLVIRQPKTIERLSKTARYLEFHCNPSAMVLVLMCSKRWTGDVAKLGLKGRLSQKQAYMSVGMAVIQMALEAHHLGLASDILAPDERQVRQIVRIPASDRVAALVGFGHPSRREEPARLRGRRPLDEIVSFEKL